MIYHYPKKRILVNNFFEKYSQLQQTTLIAGISYFFNFIIELLSIH